jgi:hypothetical protein
MSDTIHINVGGYTTDTHSIGTHTIRVWAHLLAASNWMFSKPVPGNFLVLHGISMTLINNMAIVLEGFISDICWEFAQNRPVLASKVRKIDGMTWYEKRDLYNELFTKKLDTYYGYDGIKALITFRNNLAHGRTYTELSKRELTGDAASSIETENKKYQELRDYLIGKGLLEARTTSSNAEVPWKMETAMHFVGLTKHFMESILRENESDNNLGIAAEFKLACARL